MPGRHTEQAFETAIENWLIKSGGYETGDREAFDQERGLFPADVISFVRKTQPEKWKYLENLQKDKAEEKPLDDLCRALNSEYGGCLSVLRHGFKCFGKLFRMAYFAPASGLNPDTQRLYEANRLTITRQLRYSAQHANTLDVTLALNGIPVATAELKNPMTGQTWRNAITQYKRDRGQQDIIFQFKKRTLVHFAVDTDEVWMTTQLAGNKTYFLPFNKGDKGGAGNPENPEGYKTAYLWEEVLERHSFLDILARFIHLQVEEKQFEDKKVKRETMIFPRYHQLNCVRSLLADAREKGPGTNYLVQHSAGSGKSNSIGWLAHRLASLYDDTDERVYDSVIIVTDRIVLDQQLQHTVYQFEHKQGVVQKIDIDSTQLAQALTSNVPIIITTLHKFPFAMDKMDSLPKRRYAVIIDEAHSSQGGQTATEMKGVLSESVVREEAAEYAAESNLPDTEEEILKTMLKRGKQPNISFFAFTATPKYKTLEVFGRPGIDGTPQPFHLYSMRQAIEEGFILDVLQHYTTYKTYYRLVKSIEDDPKVSRKKAARALARFVSLHPHNIAQKTEVMVEHFRHFTKHKIGGKAKAMVVTRSRLHAVRYKQAFDKYISENGYTDIKTLVAFSGTVVDPDAPDPEVNYTEVGMNEGIREKELPERFGTDEFQILLVAEKFQMGFDQPLLHTMYVDKRLSGIQAVQTLSRLNRTFPGKEDTFVLDFVNEPEEILAAFQPYYERTLVGERAEAEQLYELQAKLDAHQVYYKAEVEEFCKVFYKPRPSNRDHERMNACIDPAVNRYNQLDEEIREEFRKTLVAYRNLYAFISQVIPFLDPDLEKLYSYIRFLLTKLPKYEHEPAYRFDDEVALKYYRLQKISEGSIDLVAGKEEEISGPTSVGTGVARDDDVELSQLIGILNERFGTDFKPGDQLFFDSIREDALSDKKLRQSALASSMENFGYVFRKALEDLFIDRMEQNEEITAKFMNDQQFQETVEKYLMKQVYEQFHSEETP